MDHNSIRDARDPRLRMLCPKGGEDIKSQLQNEATAETEHELVSRGQAKV